MTIEAMTTVVEPGVPAPRPEAADVPERVGNPTRWRIAGDVVHKATETLPEFQRDMLRWLGRWAAQRNMSLAEVAEHLLQPGGTPYSPDSVYQTLTGRRAAQGANLQPFAEAVAALRRRETESAAEMATGFIETPLTRRMFRVMRRAFEKRRMTFIFGPSQVGKSTAATRYQQLHNHGETQLVRMPTRGQLTHFMSELAAVVRVPTQRSFETLRRRLLDCFDERSLLIVDEAHQCLFGRGESGMLTLEFIREIHDRRHCGIVLIGTDVLREALIHHKILRQLWLRRSPGCVISLPHVVPEKDLVEFAAAFGLDPAPDRDMAVKYMATSNSGDVERTFKANPLVLQRTITTQDGLGAWVRLLEDAQDLAKDRNTVVRWSHVLVAFCLARAAEEEGGGL